LPIASANSPSAAGTSCTVPLGRMASSMRKPRRYPPRWRCAEAGAVQISQVLHNRLPTEITNVFLFIYHVRNADLRKKWQVSRDRDD
jgi:hypothetical protein